MGRRVDEKRRLRGRDKPLSPFSIDPLGRWTGEINPTNLLADVCDGMKAWLGRRAIKGTRYLLLRGGENLAPDRLPDLEEALKLNKPLSLACYLKEELRAMWSFPDIAQMSSFFDDWCRRATEAGVPLLAALAKTLRGFRSAILNGWVYAISNGKLEGINKKIGAMQRMHYGRHDFEFLFPENPDSS